MKPYEALIIIVSIVLIIYAFTSVTLSSKVNNLNEHQKTDSLLIRTYKDSTKYLRKSIKDRDNDIDDLNRILESKDSIIILLRRHEYVEESRILDIPKKYVTYKNRRFYYCGSENKTEFSMDGSMIITNINYYNHFDCNK